MWQAIRLSIVASILLSGNLWAQDPSSSTANPSISEANPPRQANLPIRDSLWHLTRHLYEGDTEWEEGTTPAQPLYPIKANVPGAKLGFIPRIKPAANIEQKMMEALRKNTFFDNGLSENDYQRLRKVLTPNEMAIYKWLVGLDGFYLSVLRRTKSALAGEAGYSYKNFLETMDFAALQKFVQHFLPEDKNKPPHIYYDKDLHDPLPEFLDKSRIFPQYNLTQEKVGLWVELVKRQLALTRKFYFDIVEDGLGPHGQDHYQGLPPTAEIPTSFIFSQDQNPHWTATLFARAKQEQWDLNVTAKIVQAYKDSQNAKGHPLVLPEWFSRSQAYALLKYRYLRLAALIDPKARQTLDREYPFWTIKELDASFPFLNHRLSPFDLRPNGQRPSRSTKFLDTLGRLWRGTEVQREMADQYVIKSFGPSFPILVDYLNTAIAIYQRLEVFDPAITHEMYDFILRYTAKYEPAKLYSYVSAYPHEYDAFYYSNEPFFTQLAQDLAAHPFSLAQEELSPAQVELMERLARKMDELRQRPAMPIGYITEAQLRDSIPQLLQQGIQD
ncbi:MAG: hypothetical protein J6Y94_03740, partial [Bacteriovoracaceae bacterium]|nr:hypothetical protein [Bacteriovoracaceae bacterium]